MTGPGSGAPAVSTGDPGGGRSTWAQAGRFAEAERRAQGGPAGSGGLPAAVRGTRSRPGPAAPTRRRTGTAVRLAAFHAVVLVTVLGVVVVALVHQYTASYRSVAARSLGDELRSYVATVGRAGAGTDLVAASVSYLQARSLPSGTELVVALPGPRVLVTPGAGAVRADARVQRWLASPPPSTIVLGTSVAGVPEELLAAPIRSGRATIGTFVAATDLSAEQAQGQRVLLLSLAEAMVALVAGVLSSYLLLRRLLRTVGRITTTAEEIGRGETDRRLGDEGTDDEVGQLAVTFDHMLDRLDGAMSAQRRLLSDVSHQLRTPLTVARGHLEVLRRTGGLADEIAAGETVDLVVDELDHMRALVERLLLLGRALEPDFLAPEPVDLRSFLGDLHAAMEVLGPRQWLLAPVPDVVVSADPAKLRGALLNLAENAVHATVAGATVALVATVDVGSGWLLVAVEDSGPGIPPALRQEALARFARPGARDEGGSGLGLAIVKAVAEAHGGEVRIESSALGGARVVVALPPARMDGAEAGSAGTGEDA